LVLLGVATLAIGLTISPLRAQSATPVYVALGDSVEFGLGDDILADGFGYVPGFGAFLAAVLGQPVAVHNFGVPFARVREIQQAELPAALQVIQGHAPIVVSWGGGGNDLATVATSQQSNACRQSPGCLGRFNAVLNEVEQTIDHTVAALREAVGPGGRILMRTQYNALARTGCQTPENVALASATLEGAPGTLLDRGLNDRIRTVAARYDAQVVDLFVPFLLEADTLVASDCIHPSGLGYQAILLLSQGAFAAGP